MKKLFFIVCAMVLVGCSISARAETLKPQVEADVVKLKKTYGNALPVEAIEEKERVMRLVTFVNALPQKWNVPWYGPPVGKVYFEFYREGKLVGNFYAGPDFFGRDGHNFWSQKASKKQMEALGEIVGFNLWAYIHEKRS